jgi:hypothetical protein
MPDDADEVVKSIGMELVTRLAPEELPLYPSLVNQFEGTNDGGGKASSGDQILGFGAGEAMILLTPVILSFARSFWQALVDQAAQTALRGVLQHLQVRRTGHQHGAKEVPRLSEEQVQLVRKIAEQQARRLNVSDGQAGLLADAMVGVLVAPPVS